MITLLRELPHDVRARTAAALRDGVALVDDLSATLVDQPGLDADGWRECGRLIIDLLAVAVEQGEVEPRDRTVVALSRFSPPVTLRQLVRVTQRAEGLALDELALDQRLGATSEAWPVVAHSIRSATLEVLTAFMEGDGQRQGVLDPLTSLISRPVFDLVLEKELRRARRHKHGVALILFDIDDLASVNSAHGRGAGDRLIERLGILGRQFFRTHDWVARHGGDSLAVLLPETSLDQAVIITEGFCEMVQHRVVLVDHKTDASTKVTLSAVAVGSDLLDVDVDAQQLMQEAERGLLRAKTSGSNRVERVVYPSFSS